MADRRTSGGPTSWLVRRLPIVGWLRSYRPGLASRRPDRRRDGGGADRAQEPRVRRHRRHPAPERSLRGRRGRRPLRDLRNLSADLDGPELRARRGGRERGGGRRNHPPGRRGVVRRRADPRVRPAVPGPGRPADGLARTVPVASRGDGLPVRCCDRRGHRRAAEDHRHGCQRLELVPAATILDRVAGRRASRDLGARCRLTGRGVRAAGRRAAGARRTRPGRRRAPCVIPVRPRGSRRLPGGRCASWTAVIRRFRTPH